MVQGQRVYIGVGQDPEHDEGIADFWCIDLVRATRFGPENKGSDVSPVEKVMDPAAPANLRSALAWHFGGAARADADRNYIFGRTLSTAAVHDGLVYVTELAGYALVIEHHYGRPMDIEWGKDGVDGGAAGDPALAQPVWINRIDGGRILRRHGQRARIGTTLSVSPATMHPTISANAS